MSKKDMTPDGISRIGKIKFQRNILSTRQKRLNPTLIKPPSPVSRITKKKKRLMLNLLRLYLITKLLEF